MKREELYRIWAPDVVPWSAWAKPVLFATMPQTMIDNEESVGSPDIAWLPDADGSTAVIVDEPSEISVGVGVAAARKGYFPVPLFNGCMAPAMIIDMKAVAAALVAGVQTLAQLHVSTSAQPVFLLDSRRLANKHMANPGRFDNRWAVVPQDMPSAQRLMDAGVSRVIVRAGEVQDDLAHVLRRYQEARLKLELCRPSTGTLENLEVAKPKLYKNLWYRVWVLAGLCRNAAGGFGSIVPDPSTSGGG
jgi:hypothetical protein